MKANPTLATSSVLLVLALVGCRGERGSNAPGVAANTPKNAASAPAIGEAKSPSDDELKARKEKLTAEQFDVTQREGTEPPFHNAYWDEHRPGIYVDVVSGEALFSSKEKYESGTGWPSFWAPLEKDNVVTRDDGSAGMSRTEVRSRRADSHLGHVFDDGPQPTGQRYCMNSAAMRFVPAERLTLEGYGQYAKLFPNIVQATK